MKQTIYALMIVILVICGCGAEHKFSSVFLAMGNIPVEIIIYTDSDIDHEAIFAEIKDTVKMLDSIFNKYAASSPIYAFNHISHTMKRNIHIDSLIHYSDIAFNLTEGMFDIKIETVLSYYRRAEQINYFDSDSAAYYSKIEADNDLYVDSEGYYRTDSDKLMIDFGGIAKGYFGDIIKRILISNNIEKAIINIAGDIVVFNHKDEEMFRVGIRNAGDEGIFKTIEIANGAIMTSGDYFRYYTINDTQYCHIINPKTGLPHDEYKSVTVIYSNASLTDAFATAFMMMDIASIEKLADSMNMRVEFQ